MSRIIYFNGSLAITSFEVECKTSSGVWETSALLQQGKLYRFAARVLNNAGNPNGIDLTNLRVIDVLTNPLFPWLKRGQEIAYAKVTVAVAPVPGSAYRFYSSESYGIEMPNGVAELDKILHRGKQATLYIYFKWSGAPLKVSGLPGTYVPQVSLNARELRIAKLPEGPLARLQPNT
jgi:hypothetical protein